MSRALLLAAVASAVLAAAACGGSSDGSGEAGRQETATTGDTGGVATVTTSETSLGAVLVSGGMTLYLFEQDTGSESTCSGECATAWPPLTTTGSPGAADGADASELGTTTRDDGSTQVTYAGHPLYFFSGDSAPGDTNGQGVDGFGAEWYAVSPAGSAIEGEPDDDSGYGY